MMKRKTSDRIHAAMENVYIASTTIKALRYSDAKVDEQTMSWAEDALDNVASALAKAIDKIEASEPRQTRMQRFLGWITR